MFTVCFGLGLRRGLRRLPPGFGNNLVQNWTPSFRWGEAAEDGLAVSRRSRQTGPPYTHGAARGSANRDAARGLRQTTWRCFLIGPYCRFAADKRDANRTGMARHVTRRVPVRLASETIILKLGGYAARNKSVPAIVLSEKRVRNGSGSRMGRCPMGYSFGALRPPTTTPRR